MKVIIVTPYFYPKVGGTEVYALNIARQLKGLGWQVVIVTTGTDDGSNEIPGLEGVVVHRLPAAFKFSNTPVGYRWRRRLAQIYQAERPDVINAHTPVPYLADVAQRASKPIPFALTYHNDLEKESPVLNALVKVLHRTVIDRTLRQCTGIIATSEFYARHSPYLKRYMSKVSVVPPGVDLSRFNSDLVVDADLIAQYRGMRVILFVGSLNRSQRHKGLDNLIRAFADIHSVYADVRLVVVGKGDWVDAYKSVATSVGVENYIEFTGYVDDAQLAQYYKLAKIFAMPSTNRSEGFGMVYIEASAVGTPVVGCRVGGVPYAVRDNDTGILVEPRSVGDLGLALRKLLDDEALARRLGKAGAARAKAEFGWQQLGMRTGEILEELAGQTAQRTDNRAGKT